MGTAALDRKSQSIFALQFDIAWRRIWSGWGSGFALTLEIILWCLAAVELAFFLFHDTNPKIDNILDIASGTLFLVITPIIVVVAVYKSIVKTGMGDDSLRTAPLNAYQVLVPRILAVLLTWLRFVAPILILFYCAVTMSLSQYGDLGIKYPMLVPALHLLFWQSPQGDYLILIDAIDTEWKALLLYCLAILQTLGWVMFPLTWGTYWGLAMKRKGGLFLLIYVSWILIPATQAFMVHKGMFVATQNLVWKVGFFSGIIMPVLALIFWVLAVREWEKRTG